MDISLIEYDFSPNPTDKYQRYFLSGLLSGVGQIASSIIGGKMQQKAAEQQFEYQQQLNQQQNDFTEKMWNQTNEYNKADNVLQRYLDTGMSTGAAVQAMSGVQGLASNVQASSSPGVNVDYASGINAGSNAFVNGVGTIIQNLLTQRQTEGVEIDNNIKKLELSKKPEMIKLQLQNLTNQNDEILANIQKLNADTLLSSVRAEGQSTENKFIAERSIAEIEQIGTLITKSLNDIKIANQQIKLQKFDLDTKRMLSDSQKSLNNAQIQLFEKMGLKISHEIHSILADMNLAYINADYTEAELQFRKFFNSVMEQKGIDWYADKETWDKWMSLVKAVAGPVSAGIAGGFTRGRPKGGSITIAPTQTNNNY